MAMNFGWAQLLDDLLYDIAMRLECLEDLIAFADVCSSWRGVYVKLKPIWIPSMPWLILAENNDDNPQCIRTVVDLNNNKRYQMKLPETFGRHCWGCEDGWIFTLGLDMETHLFNPLTRARLSLPSALTLPLENYDVNYYDPLLWELLRSRYIQKVHVISVPPDDEILVMVIYHKNNLAVAIPGDSEWGSLECLRHPEGHLLQSLLHYGDSIAGVYEDGTLQIIKANFFMQRDNPYVNVSVYPSKHKPDFEVGFNSNLYLVDDSDYDDILAVLRYASDLDYDDNDEYIEDPTVSYQTWLFEVYSFDFGEKDWRQLNDLGDSALFVGNNSAVSVYASEGSNCKPNCIYFTDDRLKRSGGFLGYDTGIFSMRDQSVERVYHGVDIFSKLSSILVYACVSVVIYEEISLCSFGPVWFTHGMRNRYRFNRD